MGNYFGYSTVMIKKLGFEGNAAALSRLGTASHTNIVGLLEAFYDESILYFVYNYSGFAFDLSQVASTPSVSFTEPELSHISKGILRGLQFIHESLKIGHGRISGNTILLFENGDIKIGSYTSSVSPYCIKSDLLQPISAKVCFF
jgi:serine/threonine protein kinase